VCEIDDDDDLREQGDTALRAEGDLFGSGILSADAAAETVFGDR